MKTVQEILDVIDGFAPWNSALDWDNSGLQAGWTARPVTKILCALDLTPEVVAQACASGAELIVTHHPVFYEAAKQLTDLDWQHKLVLECMENGISVISVHTPWDAAEGGVNDVLAETLGLQQVTIPEGGAHIVRIGVLAEAMSVADFAVRVKQALRLSGLTYADGGRPVRKVAICGGAGMNFAPLALREGCDTFLTADLRYHEAQKAKFSGLNVLDGTHQATEQLSVPVLARRLARLSGLPVQVGTIQNVLEKI